MMVGVDVACVARADSAAVKSEGSAVRGVETMLHSAGSVCVAHVHVPVRLPVCALVQSLGQWVMRLLAQILSGAASLIAQQSVAGKRSADNNAIRSILISNSTAVRLVVET